MTRIKEYHGQMLEVTVDSDNCVSFEHFDDEHDIHGDSIAINGCAIHVDEKLYLEAVTGVEVAEFNGKTGVTLIV